MGKGCSGGEIPTAVIPVTVYGSNCRRAREACNVAGLLRNQATDWVRVQWKKGRDLSKHDISCLQTAFTLEARLLRVQITEARAHDRHMAIMTCRCKCKIGTKVCSPCREKSRSLLSFGKGHGWRISQGEIHLSIGRRWPWIDLAVPVVLGSETNQVAPVDLWGKARLCWYQDSWQFSLRTPYRAELHAGVGANITAIDEGIISPMTLATRVRGQRICEVIINGGEARAIKRLRNKSLGFVLSKTDCAKPGSKLHHGLPIASNKVKPKAKGQLRYFDRQLKPKAAAHMVGRDTSSLVAGDVRGIKQMSKVDQRARRYQRWQSLWWSRGQEESYLHERAGLEIEHLNKADSTNSCPECLVVGRRFKDQRKTHHKVQCRKPRALSSVQNRAKSGETPACN